MICLETDKGKWHEPAFEVAPYDRIEASLLGLLGKILPNALSQESGERTVDNGVVAVS